MKKLLALLLLSISTMPSWAALGLNSYGEIADEKWAPDSYTTDFKYDILYYQPASLREKKNRRSLVFMHGGGASTVTREGAYNVAKNYIRGLVRLAEELQLVLIVPSSSSLNWGGPHAPDVRGLGARTAQ